MKTTRPYLLVVAFLIAASATIGSLAMSEILHWTPCVLCWYQRILMYPLVPILAVAMVYKDRLAHRYVLALAVPGSLVALYHSLLQWGILAEAAAPCREGVSCLTRYLNGFGFITIPFLSLLAFGSITVLMVIYAKGITNE